MKTYRLKIINEYSRDLYESLKIKTNVNNPDFFYKKFHNNYVIYSVSTKKYLKYLKSDNSPVFTDKLENAKVFDFYNSYLFRNKINQFVDSHPEKNNMVKICGFSIPNDKNIDNKLTSCIIEFKIEGK